MAPSNTMDCHQHKRAYQPQITSFFGKSSYNPTAKTESISSPSLAPAVQASLLSVGMRIRKAIPEGYKTHKTKLFDDRSVLPALPAPVDAMEEEPSYSRPRELQPFCGIHRVGGLAVQESLLSQLNGFGSGRGRSDSFTSNFTSSQESNASVQGQEGITQFGVSAREYNMQKNKRRLDDDASDADDEDNFSFDFNPSSGYMGSGFPGRQFAKPRSRRRSQRLQMLAPSIDHGDFEEVSFLQPWDGEVEMGGI